jgi:putative transposase
LTAHGGSAAFHGGDLAVMRQSYQQMLLPAIARGDSNAKEASSSPLGAKNAWYFVTAVTDKRRPYFLSETACRIFLDAFRSVRKIHPYRLGALMIMPDHWHALIKPKEKEVIESIVGSIKQRVFHASSQNGGEVIQWQPRFTDHRIRDEADYFQHLDYMRLNPHRQQLVDDMNESWKWWIVHPDPFG